MDNRFLIPVYQIPVYKDAECDPDPIVTHQYVRRHGHWMVWMGGAGRSGDGLQMVSRVSVGGAGRAGDELRVVNSDGL